MGFNLINSNSLYTLSNDPLSFTQTYVQREQYTITGAGNGIFGSGLTDETTLNVEGNILVRGYGIRTEGTRNTFITTGVDSNVRSYSEDGILISTGGYAEVNLQGQVSAWDSGVNFLNNLTGLLNVSGQIAASQISGTGVTFQDTSFVNFINTGSVSGSTGVYHNSDGGEFELVNNGDILGQSYGLRLDSLNHNTIVNNGTIVGALGISFEGYDESLTSTYSTEIFNNGTVTSTGNDAISFNSFRGGQSWLAELQVVNTGIINGRIQVYQGGVGEDRVENSGTINGSVNLNVGDDEINNSGTIHGLVDVRTGADEIWNTGTIHGSILTGTGNDVVHNTGNVLYAISTSSGDDRVINSGNASYVNLGSGNDIYDGREGTLANPHSSVVNYDVAGGSGDDLIILSDGATRVYEIADQGMDTVEASASFELSANIEVLRLLGSDNLNGTGNAGDNLITGTAGSNRLTGLWGDDSVYGAAGADTLLGDQGNDFLSGGEGWDTLRGGSGDDTLLGGEGRDRLDGGTGTDRASYFGAEHEGVRADLRNASNNTGYAEGDSYISIENLYGSRLDDRLDGDDNNNEIIGHRGDDTLRGWDGDDVIDGMWDDDLIYGNLGNDTMRGGSGSDTFFFFAGNGNDVITDYTDGTDNFRFFIGGLTFAGLSISNSAGNAIINYGSGQITLNGVSAAALDASDFVF